MRKYIFQITLLITLILQSFHSQSQAYLIDNKRLNDLKRTKLYVVMATDTTDINNEYVDIFKEVWKFCPYEIIEPDNILHYMQEGAYFMNMTVTLFGGVNYSFYSYANHATIQFELSIYTPKLSFLSKLERKSSKLNKLNFNEIADKIAYIKLQGDISKKFFYTDVFEADFVGKGFMMNAGDGFLKNHLQFLQTTFNKGVLLKETIKYCNDEEIGKLKKKTLYIPSEILRKFYMKANKPHIENYYKIDEILKNYNYPGKFQVIPMDSLNMKIIENEEDFYYLSYFVGDGSDPFKIGLPEFTITNSNTGEVIYKSKYIIFKKYFKTLSQLLNDL